MDPPFRRRTAPYSLYGNTSGTCAERTEHLGLQLPDLCDLVAYWNHHARKDTPAERTMKSDILCEWEAISRRAKVDWARCEGHDVLSLQHDGVVLALRA